MAAHKCNYVIINNMNQIPTDLKIKLLHRDSAGQSSTFLGLDIDDKLNFKEQFNTIKKKCIDRLNIIKITSHKLWKLSTHTLITLYKSLVSSIFEYSAILEPHLSQKIMSSLQIIQNNALRIIFKKPKDTPIKTLHSLGNIQMVSNRLEQLAKNYLSNAIINNNPLIVDSLKEYNRFSGGRETHIPTLFDKFKVHLNTLLEKNNSKQNQLNTLQ
jgi:hypothetical protein